MLKNICVLILLSVFINDAYTQGHIGNKIYDQWYNSGGGDRYQLNYDSSFCYSGCGGLSSVKSKGYYEVVDNTIFFTYTEPFIINGVQKSELPDNYTYRRDTLIIEDSLTLISTKKSDVFYKLTQESYPNGQIKYNLNWIRKVERKVISITSSQVHDFEYERFYPHGVWKEYYSNGNLKHIVEYDAGIKNGVDYSFYQNGRTMYQGNWIDGFKNGNWIYKNEWDDRIRKILKFKKGKLKKTIIMDE